MKDKLCLKNVSLKVQKKKMLLQLRQVCGFLSFFFKRWPEYYFPLSSSPAPDRDS